MLPDPETESSGASPVEEARALCGCGDWTGAYELLRGLDGRGALEAEGLELLADCARFCGHAEAVVGALERAHHERARSGDARGAVRTALGLCHTHMDACETALAASWWRRADELIAALPEGPEHGLHAWFAGRACSQEGDAEGHELERAPRLELGRRFGDRNVEALALADLAHVATLRGRTSEALDLLDRATSLALGGEIGVLETGLVFCNAIFACRARGEWDRAQEWTASADRWVSRVQVSYFPSLCRVHRAEVLRVRGELAVAEAEALEAVRLLRGTIPRWVALGAIELGEIRRRRGDLGGAFEAYRTALEAGWEPQPGLALLLLAQGDARAAHRALERFARSQVPTLLCEDRTGLLAARITVALAAGEGEAAEESARELARQAAEDGLPWDRAAAALAAGELALARGDAAAAAEHLQAARALWAELDAPYELARACVLLGRALAADADRLGAALELEAARGIFERLGAARDRAACAALLEELGGEDAQRPDAPPSTRDASFVREGELWSVTFGGATVRLKEGKGPAYLARLLAEPGREVLALELASGGRGALPGGDAGEVLDGAARAAYRARLGELEAELEEATRNDDVGRIERHRAEIDALARGLAAAVGLGGRARRAGDPNERARQSVTKAIRGTIKRLAEAHEPLGRYLGNTIRTGVACSFDPDPGRPVAWRVEP